MTKESELFFQLGCQYYVAARFTALQFLIPVTGNLFHHAIEMFLKGILHPGVSLDEMKSHYIHRLPKLWQKAKQELADSALDRFDWTINELHRYESIRYPDDMLKGMLAVINFENRHPNKYSGSVPRPPKYEIVVKEIDELVKTLFEKASVNPTFFLQSLSEDAKAFLLKYNSHLVVNNEATPETTDQMP